MSDDKQVRRERKLQELIGESHRLLEEAERIREGMVVIEDKIARLRQERNQRKEMPEKL